MDDWLYVPNTYNDEEAVRTSEIAHFRGTKNGKTQITLRSGKELYIDWSYRRTRRAILGVTHTVSTSREPTNIHRLPPVAGFSRDLDDDIPF